MGAPAFVQESAPEREDAQARAARRARAARAAAGRDRSPRSTSGLLPSRLQADMARPERFVVGHPFNPVYLLPLVELCGGERTAPETRERAAAVYRAVGMRPLVLRREIDGFVADRLLEALWREALWLVARRRRDGRGDRRRDPLRRRPALGVHGHVPHLPDRAAARPACATSWRSSARRCSCPWTRLTDVPELDRRAARQARRPVRRAGRGPLDRASSSALRDDCLVAVLQGLRGAGRRRGRGPRRVRARRCSARADRAGRGRRRAAELHAARRRAGVGRLQRPRAREPLPAAVRRRHRRAAAPPRRRRSTAAAATSRSRRTCRTCGRRARASASRSTTQLLGHDEKRLHLFHALHRTGDDALLATAEQMLLHVDAARGARAPRRAGGARARRPARRGPRATSAARAGGPRDRDAAAMTVEAMRAGRGDGEKGGQASRPVLAAARASRATSCAPSVHCDETEEYPRELVERAAALGLACSTWQAEYGGGGVGEPGRPAARDRGAHLGRRPDRALHLPGRLLRRGRCSRSAAPGSASAGCRRCAARPRRPPRWPPTEPEAGSDAAAITTSRRVAAARARRPQKFMGNAPIADACVVFATVAPGPVEGDHRLRRRAPHPGFVPRRPTAEDGQPLLPAGELHFEQCFVADDRRLGEEGQGFQGLMSASTARASSSPAAARGSAARRSSARSSTRSGGTPRRVRWARSMPCPSGSWTPTSTRAPRLLAQHASSCWPAAPAFYARGRDGQARRLGGGLGSRPGRRRRRWPAPATWRNSPVQKWLRDAKLDEIWDGAERHHAAGHRAPPAQGLTKARSNAARSRSVSGRERPAVRGHAPTSTASARAATSPSSVATSSTVCTLEVPMRPSRQRASTRSSSRSSSRL